ncbi:hypothetical protein [Streptomyces sp. NPDC015125]|uniref:hypothetical protein n=1 Tax=Streptomyces sp. NPDC015125 TaxID=3364938 RepID=UPI0036FAC911
MPGWPQLILKLDEGLPLVVHFLADDRERRPSVSQSLVRDRLAAISEPARREPCRHPLSEPITTSELAGRMGIGCDCERNAARAWRENQKVRQGPSPH